MNGGSVKGSEMGQSKTAARDTSRVFACQECDRRFKKKSSLECHLRLHSGDKPFTCAHCEAKFTHKSTLLHHSRLHTGERPFECEVCSKTFRQRSNYTLHMKTHTLDKRFGCDVCAKRFSQRVHLTTHARLHTGEKPFACDICGQRFFQRCHLTRHQGSHSVGKSHECHVCSKTFSCLSYLTTHQRIHSSNHSTAPKVNILSKDTLETSQFQTKVKKTRVNECEVCHKKFLKKTHLKHHTYTHTGERPYPCQKCEKRFSEPGSLRRHIMRVHEKNSQCCDVTRDKICSDKYSSVESPPYNQEESLSTSTLHEKKSNVLCSRYNCDQVDSQSVKSESNDTPGKYTPIVIYLPMCLPVAQVTDNSNEIKSSELPRLQDDVTTTVPHTSDKNATELPSGVENINAGKEHGIDDVEHSSPEVRDQREVTQVRLSAYVTQVEDRNEAVVGREAGKFNLMGAEVGREGGLLGRCIIKPEVEIKEEALGEAV